mmetsp:Transcript_8173/g.13195  ORF Transcript_8173/g.13195 Transcript_8173/m.13195 type:complete len:100 (+) Transcript_8173:228-527(+)
MLEVGDTGRNGDTPCVSVDSWYPRGLNPVFPKTTGLPFLSKMFTKHGQTCLTRTAFKRLASTAFGKGFLFLVPVKCATTVRLNTSAGKDEGLVLVFNHA